MFSAPGLDSLRAGLCVGHPEPHTHKPKLSCCNPTGSKCLYSSYSVDICPPPPNKKNRNNNNNTNNKVCIYIYIYMMYVYIYIYIYIYISTYTRFLGLFGNEAERIELGNAMPRREPRLFRQPPDQVLDQQICRMHG